MIAILMVVADAGTNPWRWKLVVEGQFVVQSLSTYASANQAGVAGIEAAHLLNLEAWPDAFTSNIIRESEAFHEPS